MKATITSVTAGEDGDKVITLSDGTEIIADCLMAATGRAPMTADLGLESVDLALQPNGAIVVDAESRTNIPSIFAIGDVTDRVNLTPVAIAEGHAFADTFYNANPRVMDHSKFSPCRLSAVLVFLKKTLSHKGLILLFSKRHSGR